MVYFKGIIYTRNWKKLKLEHDLTEVMFETKKLFIKIDIKYNEHFSNIMNITHKSSQPNLTIPEIKDIKTDEDFINNNLIKIQNFICKLL